MAGALWFGDALGGEPCGSVVPSSRGRRVMLARRRAELNSRWIA